MKTENGVVVGNVTDKRSVKNWLARKLVDGFDRALLDLLRHSGARSVHEVGCGEGEIARLLPKDLSYVGSDISSIIIERARQHVPNRRFEVKSIYDLDVCADLIMCCEVLEHVEHPDAALAAICRLHPDFVLLSVPREPIWRMLNLLRGSYWSRLGNTPGHIQHWSKRSFIRFVSRYGTPVVVRSPLPWTMILLKPHATLDHQSKN